MNLPVNSTGVGIDPFFFEPENDLLVPLSKAFDECVVSNVQPPSQNGPSSLVRLLPNRRLPCGSG
jgi:hypothetical protein